MRVLYVFYDVMFCCNNDVIMMSCFVGQLQETLPKLQLEINVLVLENGGNGVDL